MDLSFGVCFFLHFLQKYGMNLSIFHVRINQILEAEYFFCTINVSGYDVIILTVHLMTSLPETFTATSCSRTLLVGTRPLTLLLRTSIMRGTDWRAQKKNSRIGFCRNYEGKIYVL